MALIHAYVQDRPKLATTLWPLTPLRELSWVGPPGRHCFEVEWGGEAEEMWCGEHIVGLLYSRFVWFSGLSPCWSILRKCRLACFARVQEKEESVPACMLSSGVGKRVERAGLHAFTSRETTFDPL